MPSAAHKGAIMPQTEVDGLTINYEGLRHG
jgi:hypothetical protein